MGKPEGIIEKYLVAQSDKHGFLCRKFVSPGRQGVPDRIVIGKGHTVFIELKSQTGKLSEIQKQEIKRMLKHGADVRVYNSKQQIDDFFKETEAWPDIENNISEDLKELLT